MKKASFIQLILIVCAFSCQSSTFEGRFPIPDSFTPAYHVASSEDLSYENGAEKIMRHQYRVVIPKDLSESEIKNNMRHLAIQTYKQHRVKNISILAYTDINKINGSYTACLYELCPYGKWEQTNIKCPDDFYAENFIVSPSYYVEVLDKFSEGQRVVLNTDCEYDSKKQDFVSASKTNVSSCATDFSDEKIKKIKNGVKGIIVETFRQRLNNGSFWIAYKVKFDDPTLADGWVLEENLSLYE